MNNELIVECSWDGRGCFVDFKEGMTAAEAIKAACSILAIEDEGFRLQHNDDVLNPDDVVINNGANDDYILVTTGEGV